MKLLGVAESVRRNVRASTSLQANMLAIANDNSPSSSPNSIEQSGTILPPEQL